MKRYKLYIISLRFWFFEPLFATCRHIVCKIPLLARRTRPKGRPSTARDDRVSCIQVATWTTFGAQTQKYYQVVGTCPAYHHKLIAQNRCPQKNRSPYPFKQTILHLHPNSLCTIYPNPSTLAFGLAAFRLSARMSKVIFKSCVQPLYARYLRSRDALGL